MPFYLALDRLFPNSFPAKVFFVAFIGTHIPLIAAVAWVLSRETGLGLLHPIMGILLCATLAGTVATLWAVWALLAPVRRLRRALDAFDASGQLDTDLAAGRDDIGRLTRSSMRMARRLSARMQEKANEAECDPLTGLLNRRGLFLRAEHIVSGYAMFIDLDGFKEINDNLGHDFGDRILVAVAHILRTETRDGDILVRIGGDEFVVAAPDITLDEAKAVAERLRAAIGEIMEKGDQGVTASVGLAPIDRDLRWSVERADKAMYQGKASGRNNVAIYDDPIISRIQA